jgi:endonuclease-3
MDKKKQVATVSKRLRKLYPDAYVELDFSTPLELMVASLLAAQNRDTTINKITPEVFRKYNTPQDYADAPTEELETDIHLSGFFRQKTRAIKALSQKLIDDFGGKIPQTMEELLTLPGIGRKTANVVLGYGFGIAAGIVVDVHNLRVNARLGISTQKLADKMEAELLDLVPKKDWIEYGQWITWHGRRVCKAIKPKCAECVLNDICPSAFKVE